MSDVWWEDAACIGLAPMFDLDFDDYERDRDLYFGDPRSRRKVTSMMAKVERKCIKICSTCPVKERCLAESLEFGDEYGIRGGLNREERLNLMNKFHILPYSSKRNYI